MKIYRNGSEHLDIKPTTAEQRKALLGEDIIFVSVEVPEKLDIGIGDYIQEFGEVYTVHQMPTGRKINSRHFVYEITFEGSQYELLKPQYLNGIQEGDFSLTANLEGFMNLLISNANRVLSSSWSLGDFPETDTRNLTFSGENCLQVLQRICQEYETEFIILYDGSGYTLHIGKQGDVLGHIYEYGKGKGLYTLERSTVTSKNLVTRLWAYGSTKNLRPNYRNYSNRLKLPWDELPNYVESSQSLIRYGLYEATKIFEEIYPHREGTVTAVDATSKLIFTDSSMDFDLSLRDGGGNTIYLQPGTSAKIHFNSGNLAGYEFELSDYDHNTKKFTLIPFTDERGQQFPDPNSSAFQIQVGDKYTILDIYMPDSYVTAAENELLSKAQEYLSQNMTPRVQYALEVDELYLKNSTPAGSVPNFFNLGDYIQIKDDDLGIDQSSRIISFTRNVLRPFQYKVNIADSYEVSYITRVIASNTELTKVVKMNKLNDPARTKRAWRTTEELSTMIDTLRAEMLLIGSDAQQFTLSAIIEPNYQGVANTVNVTGGVLTHLTVEETPVTWTVQSGSTNITDNNARYIYAKCNRSNYNDAVIVFDTTQRKFDSDSTYFYFLIGVLHSVIDGVRWISLTYGSTAINGRFIKTGRIQSADGETYFDLDDGEIGGVIKFNYDGQMVSLEDWAATFDPGEAPVLGDLAYYDTVLQAMTDETIIVGGYIKTSLINVETLAVNADGLVLAGITGAGTDPSSVRIWAGETFSLRDSADFRVQQDGKMFAANAEISGKITATSGNIGSYKISGSMLDATTGSPGSLYGIRLFPDFIAFMDDANARRALVGSNVLPFGLGGVGIFENKENNMFGVNYGIMIDVEGGRSNIGAKIKGNVAVDGIVQEHYFTLFTPSPANGNVLRFDKSSHILVSTLSSSYTTVYLPSPATIRERLGLASNERFLVTIAISAIYNLLYNFNVVGGSFTIKDPNGSTLSSLAHGKGDTSMWNLYYDGVDYIAHIINRYN